MIQALAGAAPLALAGKAVGVLTSLAATTQDGGFHDAFDEAEARGRTLGAEAASPGDAVDGYASVEATAAPILPAPPPVSQQPLPTELDSIGRLYDQISALR